MFPIGRIHFLLRPWLPTIGCISPALGALPKWKRLGHAGITTTEKYLHTLPDEDDSALDAFDKIRNRSKPTSTIRAV